MKMRDIPQSGRTGDAVNSVDKGGLRRGGSRVFIRTVQQLDGYQDIPQTVSAVVPEG
jgi:hypothetical protein